MRERERREQPLTALRESLTAESTANLPRSDRIRLILSRRSGLVACSFSIRILSILTASAILFSFRFKHGGVYFVKCNGFCEHFLSYRINVIIYCLLVFFFILFFFFIFIFNLLNSMVVGTWKDKGFYYYYYYWILTKLQLGREHFKDFLQAI